MEIVSNKMIAIFTKNNDIAKFLLDNDAEKIKKGKTAFYYTKENENKRLIKLLEAK